MKYKRVIARLDVKNNALVKGIHLEGLRVLGHPSEFADSYYKNGIDEIIYIDTVASLYERNGLVDLVRQTAEHIFVPLTVGGGIRTLSDVEELLKSGADKVCINTGAIRNPKLITEIAEKYGSSTIVVGIEVTNYEGKYLAFTDNGREFTGLDAIEWSKRAQDLGAGEILLTSVDRDGTGLGVDKVLFERVNQAVTIPIIVHGGVGNYMQIIEAFNEYDVDSICLASILHYDLINDLKKSDAALGNKSFIRSNIIKKNISPISIDDLKIKLINSGVRVRVL